jgi:2,3-bisphosphoglycerate-independent phosphoglycerate mutase
MTKLLFIVMDGAADLPDAEGKTPLSTAKKPNLDMLAAHSYCGLWEAKVPKGYNIASFSDIAILQLLGCDDYPGRGYLEALGIGMSPELGSVCLRANFATVDSKQNIIDRRAGRDENGLDELAASLDGGEIDGVRITFRRSVGHRAVLVLEGKELSAAVSDADVGGEIKEVRPLDDSEAAKRTAAILNRWMKTAHNILNNHPVNKKRKIPANFILLRGAGAAVPTIPFERKFGMKGAAISGVGIVKGIARYLGMDVIEVEGATGHFDTNLKAKLNAVMRAFENHDFVLLHVNGADEAGHDKDFKKKKEFIERVDAEIFAPILKLRHIDIVVAVDHITSCASGKHELGAVPFLIYDASDGNNDIPKFDETNCANGIYTKNPMERIIIELKR